MQACFVMAKREQAVNFFKSSEITIRDSSGLGVN